VAELIARGRQAS